MNMKKHTIKQTCNKILISTMLLLLLSGCSSPAIIDNTNSNNLSENDNNSLDGKTINGDNKATDENTQKNTDTDNLSDSGSVLAHNNSTSDAIPAASDSQTGDISPAVPSDNDAGNDLPDSSDSAETARKDFYHTKITDEILARISGKSYPADTSDCKISPDSLRYCHVLYYGFDKMDHEGELIVNEAIADVILEIFEELYINKYEIERMTLIDEYDANDELSMRDNNTSAFNYRVISGSATLSNHSYGLAIDINPLYNPYVVPKSDGTVEVQPATAGDYVDRYQSNAHFIRKYDICYNLFVDHGFTWGGDWNTKKDYQHFEFSPDD